MTPFLELCLWSGTALLFSGHLLGRQRRAGHRMGKAAASRAVLAFPPTLDTDDTYHLATRNQGTKGREVAMRRYSHAGNSNVSPLQWRPRRSTGAVENDNDSPKFHQC